jgi:hypothetical protein
MTPEKPPPSPAMTLVMSPSSSATTPVMSLRQKLISVSMLLKKKFPDNVMDENELLHHTGCHVLKQKMARMMSSTARARAAQTRPELDPTVKELMVTNLGAITDLQPRRTRPDPEGTRGQQDRHGRAAPDQPDRPHGSTW